MLGHDKGKERMTDDVDTCETQWRMTGKWDICLDDLVPLPDEVSFFFDLGKTFSKKGEPQVSAQPSSLQSNTLLLTLSPSGETFCLSVPRSSGPTWSPCPSSGHNTDPEVHTSENFLPDLHFHDARTSLYPEARTTIHELNMPRVQPADLAK
jgi:hypothetical protein